MTDNEKQVSAYTALGTARTEKVQLPEATFDGIINMPVMHQAVKAFMANQRQGNAKTKIRKYVTGGNQKPWKQKGTGRARQGSTRAPQWVGGGTVFGPIPRSYAEYVPRQVRALARKSAFNARAKEDAVFVIDAFNYDAPKTSRMVSLISRMGLEDQKVLILTDGSKTNVHLSARNLPTVHVLPYSDVSTYHILWSDVVLIESSAIGHSLSPVAETEAAPRVKVAKKSRTAKAAKTAEEREVESEKKSARKSAAKKAAAKAPTAKKAAAKKSASRKSAAKKSTVKKSPAAAKKSAAKKSAPKKREK